MSDSTTTARHAIVPCPHCNKLNRVDVTRTDAQPSCGSCRTTLTVDEPIVLTDATFDTVVAKSTVPVLVDF